MSDSRDVSVLNAFVLTSSSVPEEAQQAVSTEKVAKLVSYLCSDDAEIMNGACCTADGGWTAN